MKPQARPFKRKPLQASHMNWSTVIDEPAPDDVPSRDIREGSGFTTRAIASAPTLGGWRRACSRRSLRRSLPKG
jgi:hypothetical protein